MKKVNLATLFFAGAIALCVVMCSSSVRSERWEYQVFQMRSSADVQSRLNDLGANG